MDDTHEADRIAPPSRARPLWRHPALLIPAGLFLFWLLFSYALIDPLARWAVPKLAERHLAGQAQMARVTFDPFRLALTVEGFEFAGHDAPLRARFDRLHVDLDVDGLWNKVWHLRLVELAGLEARHKDTAIAVGTLALGGLRFDMHTHALDLPVLRVDGASVDHTDRGFTDPLAIVAERMGLDASLRLTTEPALRIEATTLALTSGAVRLYSGTRDEARATLERIEVSGPSVFDAATNRITLGRIALDRPATRVHIDRNGSLDWTRVFERPDAPDESPAPPPGIAIGEITVEGISVGVREETSGQPVTLDLVDGRVMLRDVTLDKPIPLSLALRVAQGGTLSVEGSVHPETLEGDLAIDAKELAITPFAPHLARVARLKLIDGALSTNGTLRFAKDIAGTLHYAGGFQADRLAIDEEESGKRWFGWKTFATMDLAFDAGAKSLTVGQLAIDEPYAKVTILPDRTFNIKRLLREPAQETVTDESSGTAEQSPFSAAIGRIRIDRAGLDFTDLSLTPAFATKTHLLGGVIAGLSTDERAVASVDLEGKIDEHGQTKITGKLRPLAATEDTRIALDFRNIDLARYTPYSGRFSGRRIDSGRLSARLEYTVKQRKLEGGNSFVFSRLKLGERVESPEAVDLPLDLAIALLQDGNGEIDLDVPVSGDLDDPQFALGPLVGKALMKIIAGIVTAPFKLLAGIVGGGDGDAPDSIAFDPGRADLAPPEEEILGRIGKAMVTRPGLLLTIDPAFDRTLDAQALGVRALRRDLAQAAGIVVAPDTDPGPPDTTHRKVRNAIEERYVAAFGKESLRDLEKNAKGAPADAPALHVVLLEKLVAQATAPEAELATLARARGEAIRSALATTGLDTAHITVADPAPAEGSDQRVRVRLELGVAR